MIGASAPLTGDAANYGRSTRAGIDLAVTEVNEADFLDRPLRIVYEDDQMNPREGVAAVTKLITADDVPLILGPFGSSVVLATAPIAERNRVVLLSASATADDIADAGDFIFRTAPPNSRQGANIAEFLATNVGVLTASVIFQNNDYGETLLHAFQARFREFGGEVLATEAVEEGATDLRAQITRIKQGSPAAVFFPLHYSESGLLLQQASDLNLDAVFVSADGAMTQDMLELAGPAAEGTYYTSLAVESSSRSEPLEEFREEFRTTYGYEPDTYATYYYDATLLAATAIKNGGYEGPAIRDYLYNLTKNRPFGGVTGDIFFDEKGEVSRGFSFYVVEGGDFVPLDREGTP